jgi:hypothetical protein
VKCSNENLINYSKNLKIGRIAGRISSYLKYPVSGQISSHQFRYPAGYRILKKAGLSGYQIRYPAGYRIFKKAGLSDRISGQPHIQCIISCFINVYIQVRIGSGSGTGSETSSYGSGKQFRIQIHNTGFSVDFE